MAMASKVAADLKLKNAVSDESDEKERGNDVVGSISLDKLQLGPRKKLLVLALGGLLVHRAHIRDCSNIPINSPPDVVYGRFRVFKRPYFDDFMKFCFERFEVGLWSSAMEHNIDGIVSSVMGKYKSKLLFVWDQENCSHSVFMSLEKKEKPIFLKELDKVWKEKRRYCASNTLLIDDEPCKALLNPPNTAIFPHKYYSIGLTMLKTYVWLCSIGPNGELRLFLDGLADAAEVPSYVKDHPFGQPAITPSHSDWDYYSKIVRRFGKGEAAEKD